MKLAQSGRDLAQSLKLGVKLKSNLSLYRCFGRYIKLNEMNFNTMVMIYLWQLFTFKANRITFLYELSIRMSGPGSNE